jgi:SAM-dependent methyltransferase
MPAHLDRPSDAEIVDRFGFFAIGWIWLEKDQRRVEAVEVWNDGNCAAETNALYLRPDVCAALGLPPDTRTGFRILVSVPEAPRGKPLDVSVRVRFAGGKRSDVLCGRTVRCLGFDDGPAPGIARPTDDEMRNLSSKTNSWPRPPGHLQVRQVASVWDDAFYREGRVLLNQIAAGFDDAGVDLYAARSVLDFGCGSCRVLSAFANVPGERELWGCDIDAEAIAWNQANLAGLAHFVANPALPPTTFAAGQFDAIYSVSVFTHLPEDMQFVWLNELRRILAPGGVLVASLHGGDYFRQAGEDIRHEVAERGFAYRTGALTEGLPDFYMVAYHSEAYVRARWTRYFDFVHLRERWIHGAHDIAVLRRRDD